MGDLSAVGAWANEVPTTMEAVVVEAPGDWSLREVAVPEPQPGWALVRVERAGICATDLAILHGHRDYAYPVIPGHEWAGTVVGVGADADVGWLGARVVGENDVGCLTCTACRTGRWRFCSSYQQIGFGAYGGAYARYLVAPSYGLRRLAARVSFDQGALLEPMAVALGLVARANLTIGDSLTILGDGPIGLLTLIVATAAGARRIVMSGGQAARMDLARRLGATVVDYREDDVEAAVRGAHGLSDAVVETSGVQEAAAQALRVVRPEGRVVLAGSAHGRVATLLEDPIQTRNVNVVGAGHNPGWLGRALACVEDGLLNSESLISHRYGLCDYKAALQQCESWSDGLVKSVFVMDNGS
jgi:2-desacetyl-2-hydroxyethyl bacteriochlorophyllide A dehydrogenase